MKQFPKQFICSFWIVWLVVACNKPASNTDSIQSLAELLLFRSSLVSQFPASSVPESSEALGNEDPPVPPDTTLKLYANYEARHVHLGAVIRYTPIENGLDIYVGKGDVNSEAPDIWISSSELTMDTLGIVKAFAKTQKNGQDYGGILSFTYNVAQKYPVHYPQNGSNPLSPGEGIHRLDPRFQAWATGHKDYVVGLDVDPQWRTPAKAYGQVTGNNFDVVVLGNHGEITMIFDSGIRDGEGFDFAVFENGFWSMGSPPNGGVFAELAYVEVSSDGEHFVRFDSASLTPGPVGAYGVIRPENVYGLAGYHLCAYQPENGFGTPFDLNWLRNKPLVVSGKVDLNNIRYVKIVDIPGAFEGHTQGPNYRPLSDSFGNTIHNAFKTWGSGGFDLQGIGVIHTAN